MNCKLIKFYGFFILLFFFNSRCFAQSNDSTADSSGAVVSVDSVYSDTDNIGDTVVSKTIFDNPGDSIIKWKKSPEFGYMTYLDSLLKKKKNDLRVDTIAIDKNAGSST
ncbi:MAG: hypothetical protein ACRDE8_18190, partial [Ginsengibacter sp.]